VSSYMGRCSLISFFLVIVLLAAQGGLSCTCSVYRAAARAFYLAERLASMWVRDEESVEACGEERLSALADGRRWAGLGPTGQHIVIDTSTRRLYLMWGSEVEASYPVAVGRSATPTPLGTWQVMTKGRWGEGFGARWMGLSVPWGMYGVHGTNKPWSIGGYWSGGCIRMHNRHVIELYEKVALGTMVTIVGRPRDHFGETRRTTHRDCRGYDVLVLQRNLWAHNQYHKGFDGVFGGGTYQALRAYQKSQGLDETGVVDGATRDCLGLKDWTPGAVTLP